MDPKQLLELKKRPVVELEKEVRDLRDKLWTLRRDLASGKVKNVKEIQTTRKSIAQVLTIINK